MRYTTTAAALLALFDATSALNTAKQREYSLLADMGLNPDGSSMEVVSEISSLRSLSSKSAKFSIASKNNALVALPTNETIEPEYVELPIDNFAKDKKQNYKWQGTFFNRFWVAESGYKPGGPVFVYDVGEADAAGNALFRLQNETSFFKQLVDSYGGIGIVWEHRFYGNSTPSPVDVNTPPEAFEFLTTEQSLADVDRFAWQFERKNINATLTPDKTPWIFVGGSYPAMRAAFMRDQYPDTIYASYASSAPVQASIDMSFYFNPVWRGLNAYGFGNCSRDIQAAVRHMDKIMDNSPRGAAQLKTDFLGLGAGNNSNGAFADALTSIFNSWQSYGVEGGQTGLRKFCDWIEFDPDTNQNAPAEGWAKTKGANFTVSRWAEFPWFTTNVNNYLETNCSGRANIVGKCDLNQKFTDPAMIAWTWQYCTQWGFFQSANLGPYQLVSAHNSLKHQRDICHRQFPDASPDLFPEWPRVRDTNDEFGGWSLRPSNTYWSNGEFDPWRTLSPASAESFAPHPQLFAEAPTCGDEQDEGELFGYVIPGAQHCYDFRTYFEPGAVSRQYFSTALSKWLKCFKPKYGVPDRSNALEY